ncbi:MAG: trp operon repressor [Desulfotignum sp.]|nr:trp operon repressor [Desulfotignum sp.]MCF8112499.1 trp operon repressor [Desulfotignum sp.]MCF8125295.1 trp operon repressor [Desulfotignum sp.]
MAIDRQLLHVISTISDLDELERFFTDLLTPAELDDISLRWKLLKDLQQRMPQRKIAQKYGISLCKITRGSKVLKKKDSVVGKMLKQMEDPAEK